MADPDPTPQEDGFEEFAGPSGLRRLLVLAVYAVIIFVVWVAVAIGAGSNLFPHWARVVLEILAISPILAWFLYKTLEALVVVLEAGLGVTVFVKHLSHGKRIAGAIVIAVLIAAFCADRYLKHVESRRRSDHVAAVAPVEPRHAVSPATAPVVEVVKFAPSTHPAADLNRLINNSPIIIPSPVPVSPK